MRWHARGLTTRLTGFASRFWTACGEHSEFARLPQQAPTSSSEMNPDYKWFKTSGIISPEKWGNLPGGECFTSPGEVNGRFVVDGVVGDWLCARYGLLEATPLTIEIAGNRIVCCTQ